MADRYYDAIIKGWKWDQLYADSIGGYIYEDKKGRFGDGTFIHTSIVKEITEDGYAITLNSTYKLEK